MQNALVVHLFIIKLILDMTLSDKESCTNVHANLVV